MDVHKSTRSRWRRGKSTPRTQLRLSGKRPCGRRWKAEQDLRQERELQLVAALIEESRRSQWVDYVAVMQESARASRPETQQIFGELKDMLTEGIPADLITTACCAALRLGPRIRRYRRRGEHNLREASIVANLKRKYPRLTDEDVRDAFRQNPDHRWAREVLAEEHVRQGERASSTVCVSKIFPGIGCRMASYWRRSNPQRFAEVAEQLRAISQSTQRHCTLAVPD